VLITTFVLLNLQTAKQCLTVTISNRTEHVCIIIEKLRKPCPIWSVCLGIRLRSISF